MSDRPAVKVENIAPGEAPLDLLLEADPSQQAIESYLHTSECYIAVVDDRVVGVYVIQPLPDSQFELMNIAVPPEFQKSGIGTLLLQHAIDLVREKGASRFVVCTGTFGYQLTFYQRAGFRVDAVERDYFLNNYSGVIMENGIQHKDRLRLVLDFEDASK